MKRASLFASLILAVSAGCSNGASTYADANYYHPPDGPVLNPDSNSGGGDAAMQHPDAAPGSDATMQGSDGGSGSAQTVYYFGDIQTNGTDVVATVVLPDKTTKVLTLNGISATITTMALSPDGTKLAVSSTDSTSGNGILNVYDAAAGGAATTIATGTSTTRFAEVAFSPDGRRLAFTGDIDINNSLELFVAPSDGTGMPKKVSPATAANTNNVNAFAWANDNKTVAFVGDLVTDGVVGLWTVDATAATPTAVEIVKQNEINANQGVSDLLAFDNQDRLYFKSDFETNGVFRLYRSKLDGTSREQVPGTDLNNGGGTPAPASIGSFGISPDGTKLAFSEDAPTADLFQVYVLDLSKTTATEMSAVPDGAQTAPRGPSFFAPIEWSPDGSKLAFAADWPLSAADLDNANSAFIVPASGTPGQVRIFNASVANSDAQQVGFTSDSAFLVVRGDFVVNNDTTLFATSDLTTADQDPSKDQLQTLPASGDVFGFIVAP